MTKCLIVGAGIVGLSTAYDLKKKGFDVTIVDNNKKGQSSRAAAGILFPLSPWENLKYMQELNIDVSTTNVTFLGYTFKENCSDTRNTKVRELVLSIKDMGVSISLWDPLLDKVELDSLESEGIMVHRTTPVEVEFAFLCVPHKEILDFLETYKGPLFDYKKITY